MKKFTLMIMLFLAAFMLFACGETDEYAEEINETNEHEPTALPIPQTQNFYPDAIWLVETIEAAHPIFILDELLPHDYEQRRAEYLAIAAESLTRANFVLETQKYITTLLDGHMGRGLTRSDFLDIEFTARGNRLFFSG